MTKKKAGCSCGREPDVDDKTKSKGKAANFGGKQAPPFKPKGKGKKGR